ncbi:MAG: site-2 protease family protein [Dehalococcoidia bacterium]
MLLRSLDLLFRDPLTFFAVVPLFIGLIALALGIAITVHEFSHALASYRLGDLTATRLGRLSLNPLRHLDPAGTVLLFLVGFGWGKPVPVNPYALRNGRTGMAVVSAAGPLSNIVTAALFALPLRLGLLPWRSPLFFDGSFRGGLEGAVGVLVGFVIFYNLILAMFNLLPLFPLDGSKVALGILPRDLAVGFARLEAYGPAPLLLIVAVDWLTGLGLLWGVLRPMVNYVGSLVVGVEII